MHPQAKGGLNLHDYSSRSGQVRSGPGQVLFKGPWFPETWEYLSFLL